MKLQRLKTGRVAVLDDRRRPTLAAKAGSTERVTGRAWLAKRQEVLARDLFTCQICKRIGGALEVDHIVPLEQGGAAMDMSNLRCLCVPCHRTVTDEQTRRLFKRGG